MEEYSILLGKFWGFYMVIVSLAYFIKRERMQYILDEFYEKCGSFVSNCDYSFTHRALDPTYS